jgi:hypothetical protein
LYEIMHSDREQLHMMHTSDERCTLANRAQALVVVPERSGPVLPPLLPALALVLVPLHFTSTSTVVLVLLLLRHMMLRYLRTVPVVAL